MSLLSLLLSWTLAVRDAVSWKLFVDACRLLSICAFLLCSITLTWYSFVSLICALASLYLLDRDKYDVKATKSDRKGLEIKNPYKGLKRMNEEAVPDSMIQEYVSKVLDHVLYNVDDNQTLVHFEPVKINTHCIFSKTSVLWGARDWDDKLSLEANVDRSIPALIKFLILGPSLHLDAFVFELPGDEFGYDVDKFGQGVRRVLTRISDHDPAGRHCMNKSYVSLKGWSFEFDDIPIFVTTFAPCYPENHSRYAFGAENGFVLLQPMYSFAIHDIGPDTPHTNWDSPKTVRDRIRVAYKENGRPYRIRDTLYYPMAEDLVKPLEEGPGNVVEWWKYEGGAGDSGGESDSDLSLSSD